MLMMEMGMRLDRSVHYADKVWRGWHVREVLEIYLYSGDERGAGDVHARADIGVAQT